MRHIKRIISAVLFAAMLITSLSAVTVSADESIKVILDGKQLQFDDSAADNRVAYNGSYESDF